MIELETYYQLLISPLSLHFVIQVLRLSKLDNLIPYEQLSSSLQVFFKLDRD